MLSSVRSELIAERTVLETQLVTLNEALIACSTGVASFKLDTGEGSQATTYSDPEKILSTISKIKKDISSINKRLSGTGLINLNMRRR